MEPVKLQGGSIRAGYGPWSQISRLAVGGPTWMQKRRRDRRRRPTIGLLADVLRRRVDHVHVELFVLDLDGFHEGEVDHRARADTARGR